MRLPATPEDRRKGIAGHIRPDYPTRERAEYEAALQSRDVDKLAAIIHDKSGSTYFLVEDPRHPFGKDR